MAFNKKLTFEGLQYYHSKIKTLFSNVNQSISNEVSRATAKENEIASNLSSHTSNTSNPHSVTKAQVGLSNVENKSSATIRGEITKSNVTTALGYTPLNQSLKGSASGLAELDSNGKVPSSQLPSFVDDVVEGYLSGGKFYKNSTHTTEISGESGKIYIDLSTEKTYRWSGSTFVVISETLALGETSSTAYRGDRGKTAYDHSQSTHARTDATKVEKSSTNGNIKINGTETTVYTHPSGTNPHGTTKSDVGLGNVGNFKAVSTVANQGLSDAEKANARANIGAGTSSFSGSYNDLTNKPTIPTVGNGTVTIKQAGTSKGTFTMNQTGNTTIELTDNNTTYSVATSSALGLVKSGTDITVDSSGNVSVNDDSHNHVISNVDGLQSALDGKASSSHTHTKSEVGLGNVDNTADASKNVKSSKKLQTYKQGSTTETYGDNYPVYAQWRDSSHVKLKCDNYTVETDYATSAGSAANASKVNNHTVEANVPANAKFTDTNTWRGITTSLTSTSTDVSLAASAGKNLQDQITTLNSNFVFKEISQKVFSVGNGTICDFGTLNTGTYLICVNAQAVNTGSGRYDIYTNISSKLLLTFPTNQDYPCVSGAVLLKLDSSANLKINTWCNAQYTMLFAMCSIIKLK